MFAEVVEFDEFDESAERVHERHLSTVLQ